MIEHDYADEFGADPPLVPAPSDPMAVARQFLAEEYMADDVLLLRHHRGDFHAWTGTCWPAAEDRRIRAELYRWLEPAVYVKRTDKGPKIVPFEPTRMKVANVREALQAIGHLSDRVTAPAWLDEPKRPAAGQYVVMANGLFDLRSRELLPHTPAFYSEHALPFGFEPNTAAPERWLRFLAELWDGDGESIATLAEIFGYILAGLTNQQKLFLLVGPKRSGKGTIARVLTSLLGTHNVAAPTLNGLTTNFGLSPLVGKQLALIADARLGSRTDNLVAVERLLSISGEDSLTVDRKYREPWTGRLSTRFLILSNELPRLTDSSGALASRFVLLILSRSFYGREDPVLTDRLVAEAPGIFNWALAGLDRLTARGCFGQPSSAREAIRQLEDLSSPVGAFVRDMCDVGPAHEVDKNQLFTAWRIWCENEGRDRPGTKDVFIRDLRAAVPGVLPRRPRAGEQRRHTLQGIRLRTHSPAPQTTSDHTTPPRDGHGWSGVDSTVVTTRKKLCAPDCDCSETCPTCFQAGRRVRRSSHARRNSP